MYLSEIEIIGFKSFAQRVNLKFDSGVTAIVGPNGCGKTNIVDAIRWALGEQRYSTLRSDKMEDVIFNGTKNRKPLGLAEVSLIIENTKGILPTEYSEVTITRRVFRSGESEYLLNKVPCRLKDILDLFMDTGMGPDAYSVIELKMVETILSDKADERRRLFEEAAGVTKYKFRRKAAYRKLESVQLDLARVNDIVKEVQKTVNSLERQAKKAEQYNEISTRLKSLEIDLLEREYAYHHNKLRPMEERFHLAQTEKGKIDETLQSEEEQIDQLRVGLNDIEQQLTQAQQAVAAQFEAIHRVEEKILVAKERLHSLTLNTERYEKEKADLSQQQEGIEQEEISLHSRKVDLRQENLDSELVFKQVKEELQVLSKSVEAKRTQVQQHKDAIFSVSHELIQKRGVQERLKARIENCKGRVDRSLEENLLYQEDIKRNDETIAKLTAEDKELRGKFAEAEVKLYEQEKIKKQLKDDIEQLQKKSLELQNDIERKTSRIDFLRRMIETNEGFSDGARYLLAHEGWKKKKLTTVADIVQTSDKYRVAVEVALGDAANSILVERVEDGYAALEELNRQRKGRATFICLQWLPKIRRKSKKRMNISFVWASDVVQATDRYRALINFLLDDVVIVDNIGVAADVFSNRIGVRCITLDGQIITSTGVLRGGSARLDQGGIIGKRAQITDLEHEINYLQDQLQNIATQITEKTRSYETFNLKSHIDAVKSVEKEMTAIEMRIAQLEFEKKRANDGIERNRAEIEMLELEIHELQRQLDTAGAELEAMEQLKTDKDIALQSLLHEQGLLDSQWNEKSKAVNELEIKVVTLQGDLRSTERDIDRAKARLEDIALTLQRRDEEITRAQEEITRLTADLDLQNQELTRLRNEFEVLEARKRTIEATYSSKRNELHQIELKIKDERRLHDESVGHVHELEMKISELKASIDHLKLRANEEFELDLQLKTYSEDEWVDFAQRREEVRILKERIRVLGAINFAAFDEFKTESERLTFLTQQRDDLFEAERTLMKTIEEINTTAQRKFLETFAKIRINFITTFKELFHEGDECDLRLQEDMDPLEANIEIIAKPRGKRPTSIDLLSGGEKTLTAIALLFAIYLVKPSPFCILDEVDAPLDDSNIDRYTRILKKFSDNTQFIVVTHNKRTMEAAQALYGVTMEEEGVSKIVTVRFNEEARVRSATVTN